MAKKKKGTRAKAKAKKTHSRAATRPRPVGSAAGLMPLGDRVLIKPLSREEGHTLPSGIIIPETVDKEKPEQGTVVAVGPGKRDENGKLSPVGVAIGDRVLFSKYGYDEVKVKGVEYLIVSESNILAVLNK